MLNLLYVEDDLNSRDVLRMALRLAPGQFSLVCFEDSQAFETRLMELAPKPDFILLDIHVTPFTGFDMLNIIRAHPEFDAIPVVALTASVMNEEIQLLQNAGFQGVISKPLNIEQFPDIVGRIINGEQIWYVW